MLLVDVATRHARNLIWRVLPVVQSLRHLSQKETDIVHLCRRQLDLEEIFSIAPITTKLKLETFRCITSALEAAGTLGAMKCKRLGVLATVDGILLCRFLRPPVAKAPTRLHLLFPLPWYAV